jgi:low temperature requirement protein LtrA
VAAWTLAILVDYTGAMLLWPAPWGVRPQWPVSAEYLSERYRQLFIIALGELIVIAGDSYSPEYLTSHGGHTAAFVVAVATTALLERIYTYRAGELLPAAIVAAGDPVRLVRHTLLAHLLMVIGAIAISAGYGLVIEHPVGRTHPVWLIVILGGPGLFIVGRACFEQAVFARVSLDRVIGLLLLIALAPLMRFVAPLAVAATAMAVLLGIAIADATFMRRHPSGLPSPRAGRPS